MGAANRKNTAEKDKRVQEGEESSPPEKWPGTGVSAKQTNKFPPDYSHRKQHLKNTWESCRRKRHITCFIFHQFLKNKNKNNNGWGSIAVRATSSGNAAFSLQVFHLFQECWKGHQRAKSRSSSQWVVWGKRSTGTAETRAKASPFSFFLVSGGQQNLYRQQKRHLIPT